MHIILIDIMRGVFGNVAIIVSSSNCNRRRGYLETTIYTITSGAGDISCDCH